MDGMDGVRRAWFEYPQRVTGSFHLCICALWGAALWPRAWEAGRYPQAYEIVPGIISRTQGSIHVAGNHDLSFSDALRIAYTMDCSDVSRLESRGVFRISLPDRQTTLRALQQYLPSTGAHIKDNRKPALDLETNFAEQNSLHLTFNHGHRRRSQRQRGQGPHH
nr:hypothetical protein CFP56_00242 [Quercus suber]